jgi:DNA-binding SARP family transcriptional activator
VKEIKDGNLTDTYLIDQAEAIMTEMGCYDKILDVIESLQKSHPKDEALAQKLFNAYTQSNSYQKMSSMSSLIEKQFGHPDHALYSI